ncbi:MAG TPA: pyrimidine 5'-nucleotidase [Bacillota bacterium]|nr:pyrimidine 5'-nucleotidase [Bacillota bacterium]HPT86631.1 pyrimidine 5'-nucleotidase [Bacillota bacterium]
MAFRYLILDLDNTLYPKSSGLLPAVDGKIDKYIQMKLGWELQKLAVVRQQYWKEYGTTLSGMIVHHGTDPEEYIRMTYDLDVSRYIGADDRLEQTLRAIELPKIVFSNSPREYVERVLKVLGIDRLVEAIYDIRFCNYFGKPNPDSYRKVLAHLRASGEECIFVDDSRPNIVGAEAVGMTAIWLTDSPQEATWAINQIYDLPQCLEKIHQARLSA